MFEHGHYCFIKPNFNIYVVIIQFYQNYVTNIPHIMYCAISHNNKITILLLKIYYILLKNLYKNENYLNLCQKNQ